MTSSEKTNAPHVIDARGLKCPLPVLRLEKALAGLPEGTQIVVLATDPVARLDIPLLCRQRSLAVAVEEAEGMLRFTIGT